VGIAFKLPWAEKVGYPVPPFDFRVSGVTSMSCDTHKYGYAPKGTSVVLYHGHHLLHHQYYRRNRGAYRRMNRCRAQRQPVENAGS